MEATVAVRLVLSIDDIEILSFEEFSIFVLDVEYHVGVDICDGRVVDLLFELEVFFGDALHLAEKGFLAVELATQLEVVVSLHFY